MALLSKGGKPSYTPLIKPSFTALPVPDMKVLKRDGAMVGQLARTVQEQITQIGADGSHLSEDLGNLQAGLLEVFTGGRPSELHAIRRLLSLACHMGYLVGLMEKKGGVAKPGYSEGHYWSALVLLWTNLPPGDFDEEATYALLAAYYVARAGADTVGPMVTTAARWAAGQAAASEQPSSPTTVTYSTDELDEPLSDLLRHVHPDEKSIKDAPVGHMAELAVLLVTDKRVLWRFVQPGAPVLSLNFDDVWEVKTDQGLGVLLTYRPADFPHEMRTVNPNGELDAEFIFQRGDEDIRELVLGRAHGVVQLRATGATLAAGEGFLEGILKQERYEVHVEAHESSLVIFMGGAPIDSYPYTSVRWSRVASLSEGLQASVHLGVGSQVIWMSLNGEGVEDRWRLAVKPDDFETWRVIFARFGIRDRDTAELDGERMPKEPLPNSPCPCGAGKKYKFCHGRESAEGTLNRGSEGGTSPH